MSQPYQVDQSISVFRVTWVGLQCVIVVFPDHTHLLQFFFHFYSNTNRLFCKQTAAPDQTPYSVASDLGLRCLPVSDRKKPRLIWVN